ncbi:inositol monophosphatase [Lentzea sp. NBRC 105346]|uniref:inositol monophosphatase family protein n=1 Tax=Lentzea sp. NBRC 105346 TaxID=3032205 RepID=UPI0024A5C8A3|nr:inositol monophosphatase family protein [Lentzea sp. NBRC 105346]GLZ35788.1 inositol monophosphatase [Lentzea sp. NBRC 105346]
MRQLLPIAREAVAVARRIIRSRPLGSVVEKSERDLVTDVDLAVEDAVRSFLARETPEIGVLGEERGHTGSEDLWWALDPVDGTTNFSRGMPLCGVSLALVSGSASVVAAIDLPYLDETYSAVAGEGAFVGVDRISCSTVDELSSAVISIGDFAIGPGAVEKNRRRLELLSYLGSRAQRIRMLGTAAIDLAWVASGRLDASIILANMPWDTMAGVLLVREAGGVVVDTDDTDHTVSSKATIAVCPGLRKEILALLSD